MSAEEQIHELGPWIDHQSLFAETLPARLAAGACCLIVFDFLSWREIGDIYGHHGVDEAVDAIKSILNEAVPPNTLLAQPLLGHFLAVVDGDLARAVGVAKM